jgi:hypothetical protein
MKTGVKESVTYFTLIYWLCFGESIESGSVVKLVLLYLASDLLFYCPDL